VESVPSCRIEDILPPDVLADGCDPDPNRQFDADIDFNIAVAQAIRERKPATQAVFEHELGGEA
jgi:hypothetical protein